jgi:hypothetical protein
MAHIERRALAVRHGWVDVGAPAFIVRDGPSGYSATSMVRYLGRAQLPGDPEAGIDHEPAQQALVSSMPCCSRSFSQASATMADGWLADDV